MSSYLALDIGEKRIGVAIADTSAPFPAPLTTLEASETLVTEFKVLLKKHHVTAVVIGFPRNQKGVRTAQTARVEKIATLLNIPPSIPVHWQDESLTSVKAEAELEKRKKPYNKGDVDALAATYILEDFVKAGPTPVSNLAATEVRSQPATDPGKSKSKRSKLIKAHSHKKSKRRPILAVITALAVLCLIAIAGLVIWYNQSLKARTKDDVYSVITVKSGSGTKQIAAELEKKGVIRSAAVFSLYVKFHSINTLQAGAYRLSSKQPVPAIVKTISGGKVTSVNMLIAPGLRLDQIEAILKKEGYSQKEIDAAFVAVRDHPLLKDVPADAKLEGYLYPETYKIGPDTTAEQLIRLMLDTFQQQLNPEILNGIVAHGLSFNQAVTLASIVQKEVSDPETQRTVAQVFQTRLKAGTMLGSDVTFNYAAAVTGQPASPELDSPYNTRKYTGLPPTAISNFNLSALKAVANPTATDYLFFVAGDDGQTHFSHTLEEHQALTKQYCQKLCN